MAAELVETTRLYARNVARIEPEWIEPLAVHLVKRHYFDPHWDKARGMVMAYERVTLYGLTIVPKRRVHYGPINPLEAREIFIHKALAAGELETRGAVLRAQPQARRASCASSSTRRAAATCWSTSTRSTRSTTRSCPEGIYNARGLRALAARSRSRRTRSCSSSRANTSCGTRRPRSREALFPDTLRAGGASSGCAIASSRGIRSTASP